ncbi:MAG: glycosyltransferase family 2 protein [Candidatus Nanopelagicales bacterium]
MTQSPTVGVVVVAYGDEPLLSECIHSALASTHVTVSVVVVDNGFQAPDREVLESDPAITWIRPGANVGFTGGCNLGARAADSDILVLLNSDAVVRPDALAALVDALRDPTVGIATGKVLLYRDRNTVNSVGNPVHYSLLAWAGGWGAPAADFVRTADVASASGCLLGIARRDWEQLGGFHEELFAYGEDVEFSLRMWASGRRVVLAPQAVAFHDYEFSRNPTKMYLLERNRWINLLTIYQRTTLLSAAARHRDRGGRDAAHRAATGLAQAEVVRIPLARGSTGTTLRHEEGGPVQSTRTLPDTELLRHLSTRIEPSEESGAQVPIGGQRSAVTGSGTSAWGRAGRRSRPSCRPARRVG